MSATIDNRIVEMQFDNGQFEKNVQVSLKSLEELKKGLELDKAASSLSNLEKAANKFDLSAIENAVTSLQQRFSTLGIIGMTALENITNRAVTAGVQMVKSLSIDQIAGGMSKYEAETGSVATMQYAIEGGLTEEGTRKIYENIEKLQSYADETSYSFSTMVDNMGKFVNAGVDLEKAEQSMEGIANWAAKSGVSAQSANFARVMYNLSQAMGQGQVRLMDWMSIENAQMATMDFKKEVMDAAVAVGTLTKEGDQYYTKASKGNKKVEVTASDMRNSLQKGWFTTDVLTKVLGKYADRTTEFGHEAFLAAQQARTFTDAIEATKDAVSTGWARSFRIIFGDVNQATRLFTDMANGLIEVVDGIQEFRNTLLQAWAANKGRENLIQGFANIWHMLQGISTEVQRAFGWLVDGVADQYGEKLAELSEGFRNFTEKGLALFDTETITEVVGGTTKEITGGLKEMSDWSIKAEESIRGMVSKKMKPKTVEQWNEAADAIKDLNDYVNSGSVDLEVYKKKAADVATKIDALKKTNKLSGSKKKGLDKLLKSMDDAIRVEHEFSERQKELGEEGVETETTITYYSRRLRPVIQGLADIFLMFKDVLSLTGGKLVEFSGKFKPLVEPVFNLAASIGLLISHIRETGVVTESFRGWLNQLESAFSPLTDKIQMVAGWITELQNIIFNGDFKISEDLDKNLTGAFTFLNGPVGEKIKNVGKGLQAFGNIAVRSLAGTIRSGSEFIATFILPLVGPVANAALDFLSGLGKILTWLDQGLLSEESFNGAIEGIKNFFGSIRDFIVNNPIFQRAKTILTAFFALFSRNPRSAMNYLKAVGRGLLDTFKKTQLYQKASEYISSFAAGIKATFQNSKLLKKARLYATFFFKEFRKNPIKALKSMGNFIKNMALLSKPVQLLKDFGEKAKAFLGGLFPQKEVDKVSQRMNLWKRNFQKAFETKGVQGVFNLVKGAITKKLAELGQAFVNSPLGKALSSLKSGIVRTWNNLMTELENNPLVQMVKAFLERLSKAYEENGIGGAIDLLRETVVRKFTELKNAFLQNGIVQAVINLKNRIQQALSNFAEKVGLDKKLEAFRSWLVDLKKTFDEKGPINALTKLKNTLALKFQNFTANFNLQNIIAKVKEWGKALVDSIKEVNVGEAFTELKNVIKEKIKGLFPKPSEILEDSLTDSGSGEESGKGVFETFKTRIFEWVESLKAKFMSESNGFGAAIGGLVTKLMLYLNAAALTAFVFGFAKFLSGLGNLQNKLAGTKPLLDQVSNALKSLAIAIGVIAASLLILSFIPKEQLESATTALVTCLTAVAVMAVGIKALGLESAMGSIMKAGIGIGAVAVSVFALALATQILGKIDWKVFRDGLGSVIILLGVMAGFLWLVNKIGGTKFDANWKSILAVTGAIIALMFAVGKIGKMDPNQAKQGIIGVTVLLIALGGAMAIMNTTAKNGSVKSVFQVLSIAFAMGRLAKAVKNLGKMSSEDMWRGVAAVGALALFVGLLSQYGGVSNPEKIGSVIVSAIVMAGLLYVFAEQVKKVADIPWTTMIAFAVSFGVFVLSLSGALTMLSTVPFPAVLSACAGLGLAIIAIGGAVSLALKLGGDAIQALSGNMWVVASKLSSYSTMVTGLNTEAINTSIQIMKDFATAALEVAGTPSLETFGKTLIDMGADLSLYNTNISGLDKTKADQAIQMMQDFSAASDEVSGKDYSKLDAFGKTMTRVGANLRLYSILTTGISPANGEQLKTVAADIGAIYESLKDVTDVGDLTSAITNIGSALRLYYTQTSDITVPDDGSGPDLTKVQQIFRDLANAMPADDTIKDISSYAAGGGNDMTQFALGLEAIGGALKDLGTNVEGITEESLKPALDLIGVLTTLNTSLKPENFSLDFLGAFHIESEKGEADLQQFANDIVILGGAISGYGTAVQGVTSESIDPSLGALDFFQKLREKVKGNGWEGFSLDFLNVFHADKTEIDAFAEDIVKLGGAVANFATSLKGEDGKGLDSSQIEVAKSTISFIAELNKSLPEVGGLKQIFGGTTESLDSFASQMSTLGDGVAQYADKVAGHDFSNAAAASQPIVALARAQNLIQGVANWTGLDAFGQMLPSLGENLITFQTNASTIDAAKCREITGVIDSILTTASNWTTVGNAQQGAQNAIDFLNQLVAGRNVFGDNTFGGLAGELAADFWSSFYAAINDQNGTYNVAPNGMNLSPTITPVYNMGNLASLGGTVNGQLQNTLDTSGAATSVSDIAAGINSSILAGKLDTVNSYLSLLYNTTSDIQSTNHSDLSTVNSSIGELGDRLSITFELDGQVIAMAVAPKVDKILGDKLSK